MFNLNNRCTCRAVEGRLKQMTHDLRSPVNALGFTIEHLLSGCALPSPAENVLKASLERIKSILDEARLRETKVLSQVAVVPIVRALMREKEFEYQGRRVKFRLKVDKVDDYVVHARKSDLERMLSNVLNNAVEAYGAREEATVSIRVSAAGGQVRVQVSDAGPGIPPEVLARVGKVPISYSKPGGTGLGLYHAAQVLAEWGGKLEISSSCAGTRVRLVLLGVG